MIIYLHGIIATIPKHRGRVGTFLTLSSCAFWDIQIGYIEDNRVLNHFTVNYKGYLAGL